MIFTGVFSTLANDGLSTKQRGEGLRSFRPYLVTGMGLKLSVRLRIVVVDVFILIILRFFVSSC